ncbi:MAG TPA: nickel pincer cofactor biosynthesis protein LarC [Atribacteraceae bacterium]|nr:nickel pincer cofactor biosynthesis protein LarC [Atribacteraceae bacterium]
MILYLDCFSGISGDMFLGALFDLGLQKEPFCERMAELGIPFDISVKKVKKGFIQSTLVEVSERDAHSVPSQPSHYPPHRRAVDLIDIVNKSAIPLPIRNQAVNALWAIARAEGKIHGINPTEVHLHELSGLDTLIDLCGGFLGLAMLGVTEVFASPIPTGRGWIETAHGLLPVPAPATLELLKGIPVYPGAVEGELTTPTGAALLTTIPCRFDFLPPLRIEQIGYGAGQKNFPQPNVLRAVLGHYYQAIDTCENIMIETNLDDMNPQIIDYLSELLFEAGALDVFLTSVSMKKFRTGFRLSVLATPICADALQALIFRETSTLGLRSYRVQKISLPRRVSTVETPWGPVRVKVSEREGRRHVTPEYDDCKSIARESGIPILEIMHQVEGITEKTLTGEGNPPP